MLPLKLKDYIDSRDGSFLITGPPGSGKTFLLTDLLEYLINEKNYDPARILVFCFNRRWAKILRDMSAEKINRSMPEIQITSIYAFCTDLLERIKSTYGMVRVLNAPARWRMLRDLIITDLDRKRYPISFKYLDYGLPVLNSFIQEVFDFILRAQENLIKPGMMLDKFTAFTDPFLMELAGIYMNFVDELKKKDLYDYGRLLTDTLEILKNDPGARDAVKKKYDIMIVDEVQEVNRAQFEIIEYLKNKKCIYFGNDDECIYAFRGSKTGSFSEVFNLLKGGAENSENILQLKVNYRSHQVIDQICREFITRNRQRVEKESDCPEGSIPPEKGNTSGCVIIREFKNTLDELNFICHRIRQLIYTGQMKPENVCIIIKGLGYRTKLLESALEHNGIPYTRRGSRTILDHAFVKHIINFAKLVVTLGPDNSWDALQDETKKKMVSNLLVMLLSSEFSGISPSFIKNLSSDSNADLWRSINSAVQTGGNPEAGKIRDFIISVNGFIEIRDMPASDFIFKFLNDRSAGMADYIFRNKKLDLPGRESFLNATGDFLKSVQDFVSGNPANCSIAGYLDFIDAIISSGFIEEIEESTKDFIKPGNINIMSYHQCKGLEFDAVFLPFINKNYLPSIFTKSQLYDMQLFDIPGKKEFQDAGSLKKIHLENERKLFYTGISRARNYLTITSCLAEEKSVFFEEVSSTLRKINEEKKKQHGCKQEIRDEAFPELKRRWLSRKRSAVAFYRENSGIYVNRENFLKDIIYLKVCYPPSSWWINSSTTCNRRKPFENIENIHSYTSLSGYKECPMKYKFRFYFRIKEPENLGILIGGIYHKILKRYFECQKGELTLELLKKLVAETVDENEFDFAYLKEEVKDKALISFQDYFEKYVAGRKFVTIMEKDFSFKIGKNCIRGRIDQINLLEDGKAELVDFKSGKKSASSSPENDIQLPLYRLAVNSCNDLDFLKGREMALRYIFLGDEKVNQLIFPVETYDFKGFSASIIKMISQIKKECFEPDPSSSYLCSNCQFKIACDFKNYG